VRSNGTAIQDSIMRALTRALITLCVVGIASFLLAAVIGTALWNHAFAYDFRYATWEAGRHVLDGTSPFVAPDAINAHGPGSATGSAPTWFVYPAPAALLFVPFALLPLPVGEVLFTLVCLAAVWSALALLEVRNWRWYIAVLLWPGVLSGVQSANLSLLLLLGVAVMWRFRDRPVTAGVTVGLVVALKLFVWPLAMWLVATRRYLQAGYAVVAGVAINVMAWAIIGFDEIPRYRDLLRALTRFEHGHTSSWTDVMLRAGAGDATATTVPLVLAAIACAATIALGRRGDERGALTTAIIATLAATPIMWSHYYALLLVPLIVLLPILRSALQRPRAHTTAQPFVPAAEST
jgi:alpha-1,2-mannosyltransferase